MNETEQKVLIKVNNLHKSFTTGLVFTKEVPALNDVSFELYNGEILSIVGESGSGKSTTANIILRLIKPTTGEVSLFGRDINSYNKKEFYRNVQVIFQDPFASYNLFYKVDRMLHLAFRLMDHYPALEERNRKIKEVFDKIGLRSSELLGRYPHQLSGGQLQRMLLARVLLINPAVLIADEATSMIDASSRAGVLNLLDMLAKEQGLGIIFITHDIGQAQYLSDRVIVMEHGKIVEQGDPAQVLVRPEMDYTKELIASVPTMEEKWLFEK